LRPSRSRSSWFAIGCVTLAVAELAAVDGTLQAQAIAGANYFFAVCRGPYSAEQSRRTRGGILKAYRWQYIVSGVGEPRFQAIFGSLINEAQRGRTAEALTPIMADTSN
jgi:hypothetical protein